MTQFLIKNGTIITMDKSIGDLEKGDVLVKGERIVKVARTIRAPNIKVIDAKGMIVMPGLVNAHLHTWQTGIRGIAGDWSIPEYLHHMHTQIAPKYSANDTYIANLVGSLNQINCGATTIFDWCHNNSTPTHSDAAIEGLKESGIRAIFGHGSPKPEAKKGQKPFTHIPHPKSEIERLRKGPLSSDNALITLGMSILGPDFSTWNVTEHDFRLAKDFDLLVSAHVWGAPNRINPDGYFKLAKENLLDNRHNLVHGVYLGERELKLIVEKGASVTVTPEVELQMGYGLPLTGRLRNLGVRPSIGVDIESNISGDMFSVIRMALQNQRNLDNRQKAKATKTPVNSLSISPREALEWATINNAAALRLDNKIGSLSPGKKADIIFVNSNDLNIFPVHNPVESIVFHANGSNVDTVIINGKVRKRKGKLLYRDLEKKKELLIRSGRKILKGMPLLSL